MTQRADGSVLISVEIDDKDFRKGIDTITKQLDKAFAGLAKDFAAHLGARLAAEMPSARASAGASQAPAKGSDKNNSDLTELIRLQDEAAKKEAAAAKEKETKEKERLEFIKDYVRLSKSSNDAVQLQQNFIAERAEKLRADHVHLADQIDAWEKRAKTEAGNKADEGLSKASTKYIEEWTNAAEVAGKAFDTTVKGMETLGGAAFDALFDNVEFRADKFLKGLAREFFIMGMKSFAGSFFAGFSEGGYTGGGSTGEIAGVVHGKEYVLNAAATRSIGVGTLDAINASGSLASLFSGRTSAVAASPAVAGNVVNINVENHADARIGVSRNTNSDGSMDINILVEAMDSALADRAARGRSSFARALDGRAAKNSAMPGFRV